MIELRRKLREALARPLPGLAAQLRMCPQPRLKWNPERIAVRDGAALLLLYPLNVEPHLVLTVRGADLRHHTGQVSLPGGRVDTDETIQEAALRETEEEIGVPADAIEIVGALTPLQIPVSGFVLHPIVGVAEQRPQFTPHEREVARIIEVPLALLRDPATARREMRVFVRDGATVDVDTPYFDIGGEKVWGATAMVLAEFLELIN